jgi:hypothetical protein
MDIVSRHWCKHDEKLGKMGQKVVFLQKNAVKSKKSCKKFWRLKNLVYLCRSKWKTNHGM